jgi:hypothetical protein
VPCLTCERARQRVSPELADHLAEISGAVIAPAVGIKGADATSTDVSR